ncbi:FAD-dependent oxidoreductase [Tannerella forsythia]|uniref:FAD-dependent oxidoreductase n=1 Tax=Tannerella forsythia TaxID=28112 RepID=UPI0006189FDE|nr:FAD-dependent oxidoreductase [Tannerella forsythia]BAR48125.1 putative xanthan lyase [Tannerella forsythia 3313]
MISKEKITFLLACLSFISPNLSKASEKGETYDVVIYGGTSAGIASAIQVSRMGKSVIVIEPTGRIGGLTTGGLGQTDIGNKQIIGGIAREFYRNIRRYYDRPDNWKWQKKEAYMDSGQTNTEKEEETMWTFEPSAALSVYQMMLNDEKIILVHNQRLNRKTGVKKQNNRIFSIEMENGSIYRGKMFIDATYEGDLMAAAGVSYSIGRESNKAYGETLNGVQANRLNHTLTWDLSKNGYNHNFSDGVDPYIVKGDPTSGLLPYITEGGRPGTDGHGDHKVQAYCFRMTLTDHPENKIPFQKPDNYNELNYELLFRNFEVGGGSEVNRIPWINSPMPNRKTDTNNRRGFSTDFIGQNYTYPEADYEEREKIIQAHRDYQQGLMWTLAFHPRIPQNIRNEVSRWGTCKDEYEEGSNGWQQQLYIREARRMKSDYVMTQKNCERIEIVDDPVGMGAYGMDSHHVQRYVDANGFVQNEGNVEALVSAPYPISFRSIVPKRNECRNLLVPICVSSTHIAFGSIRMEPVFMVLGQSAATVACIAIDSGKAVQDIDYALLRKKLLKDKQILETILQERL